MTTPISVLYTPPNPYAHQLPKLTITAKMGNIVAVDWYQQKTVRLFGLNVVSIQSLKGIAHHANKRVLEQVMGELDEYFLGSRQVFNVPLDLSSGTAFQTMVWQHLCHISYGETISYKELAVRLDRPFAFRAVANANGRNPISLIVPCHRVITSDGSIGGYTGGVRIKKILLDIEIR